MSWFLLALLGVQASLPDTALARYQAATRAEFRCEQSANPDELVVCGRRDADRYRVPLIEQTPGDPRIVDAIGERQRLVTLPRLPCGTELFIVNCGSVGLTATANGRGVGVGRARPLAP